MLEVSKKKKFLKPQKKSIALSIIRKGKPGTLKVKILEEKEKEKIFLSPVAENNKYRDIKF